MDGYSIGNKTVGYFLTIAAGCAGAYNLLLSVAAANTLNRQMISMVFCCAAVLFLPCFFGRLKKTVFLGVLILLAWGLLDPAEDGFRRAALFLFQEPGPAVVHLVRSVPSLPVAAGIFALAAFLCGRKRLLSVLFWAVNTAFPCALFLMGYPVSLAALVILTECSALLFVRADVSAGKAGENRTVLRSTALAALVTAGVLVGSQFTYDGLHRSFGSQEKLDFSSMLEQFRKGFYSVSGFHDYDPDAVLGRKMVLDSTPVLDVKANGPVYLRGRIYDTYTGKSWQVGNLARANSLQEKALYRYANVFAYYSTNVLGRPSGSFQVSDFARSDSPVHMYQISITAKTENQKYLFLPELSFYSAGIGQYYPSIKSTKPIQRGHRYSFTYLVPNPDSRAYPLAEAAMQSGQQTEMQQENASMRNLYGSVNGLTPRTVALAKKITNKASGERQKAEAISSWLQKNCSYTLSPPQPWSGRDLVDFFLFDSHQGYCQHFATAMVVLLRASGVPARYVEGYAVPSAKPSQSMNLYEITNAQAHAWVEYYSPRYGFLTADPTPGSSLPMPANLPAGEEVSPSSVSSEPKQESSFPSSKPKFSSSGLSASSSPVSAKGRSGNDSRGLFFSFLQAAGVILLLAAAVYGGSIGYRAIWFAVVWHGDGKKMPLVLYRYFVRVLMRSGFEVSASCTPKELAAEVDRKIHFSPISFGRITGLYNKVRYGGYSLTDKERQEWLSFYRSFRRPLERGLARTFRTAHKKHGEK